MGRRLIEVLRERGHEVRALARSEAAREAVRSAGAEPVEGDLSDVAVLQRGMAGCDVIFHVAALTKVWGPREEFVEANVRGTERVVEAARAAGVKRLVHVSTEAVLVDGDPLVNADETRPLPERPIGLYPSTKNQAERLVRSVNSAELTTVVVRPRLVWGKGDTTVLPHVVQLVKAGKFAWLSGGHYKTSTCHVDNCVEGMLLAAEKGRGGEVYFLTDGEPVEFRQFMTALLKTQGVDPGRKSVPAWLAYLLASTLEGVWVLFGLQRPPPLTRSEVLLAGQEMTVSDAKARQELGYQPRVTREEGLRGLEQATQGRAA